jgi:hypothetical protein
MQHLCLYAGPAAAGTGLVPVSLVTSQAYLLICDQARWIMMPHVSLLPHREPDSGPGRAG